MAPDAARLFIRGRRRAFSTTDRIQPPFPLRNPSIDLSPPSQAMASAAMLGPLPARSGSASTSTWSSSLACWQGDSSAAAPPYPQMHKGSPSSGSHLKDTIQQKSHVNVKPDDIYKRLLMKVDQISYCMDRRSRLLEQLEVEINENKKNAGAIDVTPVVLSITSSLLVCSLYNYFKG